jgi:hypothetical protein
MEPKTDAVKKTRKTRKKREAAPPNALLGLTATDCPASCTPECCVISGKPYCAHPRKGGLQSLDMVNDAAVERSNKAVKALAHAGINKRLG